MTRRGPFACLKCGGGILPAHLLHHPSLCCGCCHSTLVRGHYRAAFSNLKDWTALSRLGGTGTVARAAKDAGRVLKLGGNHGFHGGAKAELGRCARADSSGGKPIIITCSAHARVRARTCCTCALAHARTGVSHVAAAPPQGQQPRLRWAVSLPLRQDPDQPD